MAKQKLTCPRCGEDDTSVVKTVVDERPSAERRRVYSCGRCQAWFETVERLDFGTLRVAKRPVDGEGGHRAIEPFDVRKIKHSIARAYPGKVDSETSRRLADSVAAAVWFDVQQRPEGVTPEVGGLDESGVVETRAIDEAVLEVLQRHEPGAHIRYELARRRRESHHSVEEFLEWLWSAYGDLPTEDGGPAGFEALRAMLLKEYRFKDPFPEADRAGAWDGEYPVEPALVVKRNRSLERFDITKLAKSLAFALKYSRGRGEADLDVEVKRHSFEFARAVNSELNWHLIIDTGTIVGVVLRLLSDTSPTSQFGDALGWLRYASGAKRYSTPLEFAAEGTAIAQRLQKSDQGSPTSSSP